MVIAVIVEGIVQAVTIMGTAGLQGDLLIVVAVIILLGHMVVDREGRDQGHFPILLILAQREGMGVVLGDKCCLLVFGTLLGRGIKRTCEMELW